MHVSDWLFGNSSTASCRKRLPDEPYLYSSMGTFERKVRESPTYNLLINDLIKLNKVNGSNVNELRELHDRIKSNVGAF